MALLIKMGIRFRIQRKNRFFLCGRNSAVECQLPKLDVVGSSPIARSKLNQVVTKIFVTTFF